MQKLTAASLLGIFLLETIGVCAQQNDGHRLADGTKVPLRLVETLSWQRPEMETSSPLRFEDVVVGNQVVIRQSFDGKRSSD